MRSTGFIAAMFLGAIAAHASTARAAFPQQQVTTKGGHTVRIVALSMVLHDVYLGNRLMYRDDGDSMVLPAGSYSIAGTTYFLISDESGGTACPSMYRVVIAGARNIVTRTFGTCSDVPNVAASGSELLVTLPKINGDGETVYTIQNDGTVTAGRVARQYLGSGYHSGENLARLVLGKSTPDAFGLKATAQKLESVLGPAEYKTISTYVVGEKFYKVGDYAVGSVCEAHLCGPTVTALVFDDHGNAWVRTRSNGMTRWFGNPSAAVVSAASTVR